MLETRDLSVFYGAHRALEGASVKVEKNEIVVMLGANGAGKSTFLRAIGGITPAAEGSTVLLDGADITGHSPDDIVEAGIALVPEDRGIFADLTVRENLLLGAYPERARAHEAENLERVLSLFPKLGERQSQAVHTMSGGERQMVAIGRAMMSHPTILMLDEPSLGLSPLLCKELFRSLEQVKDTGVGIFLVEQNAKQSLAIADRGYLLDNGHISGADSAEALSRDQAVIDAYLGGGGAKTPARAPARAAAAADPSKSNGGGEDNPYAITAAGLAGTKPRIEDVLPVSIDDLVANAANVSSDHVASTRTAAPEAAPAPSAPTAAPRARPNTGAGDELQEMLASFEKAAADALSGKTRPAGSGSDNDGH
ncbi:MAG: ABC transporter ATP-binding protein [Rhodospirillaceae bacterium]|jgi:branched-chain amino acid transport system ATP-binding protein|nr:ABC transporter ATP-binding protein [Rhodospirillaceae bacterium]MBT3884839.1 ABC transporter ATP-binding protein [Rhodospirillaceae bacterium]MBT4116815.1 ABC transporter ATP-binding protein [Rhodospirillaceae bacterium]MBT4673503.1 ABC transporter ATP-binding protein [Rhodospirillaceae bacterium]MBT4719363.1 ABC transporter ATP-binding protein [Rhodospirillaceae bacterium]